MLIVHFNYSDLNQAITNKHLSQSQIQTSYDSWKRLIYNNAPFQINFLGYDNFIKTFEESYNVDFPQQEIGDFYVNHSLQINKDIEAINFSLTKRTSVCGAILGVVATGMKIASVIKTNGDPAMIPISTDRAVALGDKICDGAGRAIATFVSWLTSEAAHGSYPVSESNGMCMNPSGSYPAIVPCSSIPHGESTHHSTSQTGTSHCYGTSYAATGC